MKEPEIGKFMIHIMGEGHDEMFDTVDEARGYAKHEIGPDLRMKVPVAIVQIIDVW